MSSVEYKVLFEVRFLHDYYLYGTEPTGERNGSGHQGSKKSFFAMHADQQSFRLAELLRSGQYDMRKDLNLLVNADEKKLFKKMRMKLVRTATGFFVGIQVKRVASGNGEVRYKPVIYPPKNTCVTVGLSVVNPLFTAFSNLSLDQDTDNLYYFTNEGTHHNLSLASPIRPVVPGQQYRMGDLATVAGNVQQATVDNKGSPHFWTTVAGQGFIHQGDRRLKPQEDWYKIWRSTSGLRSNHPLGLIKIALTNASSQLSPINEDGLLTKRFKPTIQNRDHPVFELRWLSRSTYWRYRKRDGFSVEERNSILNANTANSFLASEEDQFVTQKPWPITRERPAIQFPYAQPGSIKKEGGKVFSDIVFNEINPVPE